MSEAESQAPLVVAGTEADRPAPLAARDRILPALVGLSLLVHATMFLPSLLRAHDADRTVPKEIPVEIVQLPPPPKPAPKPPPQKAAAEQPKPPQAAKKEVAKKEATKKETPKPEPKKVAERKEPPKPAQKTGSERLRDLLGSMPAVALPGTSADGTENASYSQLVLSKVAKAKKEGRYQGYPAAASVSFTLGDTGEVAHVEIVHPSGDPSLDAEAVAMIRRGAPYPPPPPGGRREYTVTLRFQALT